MSEQNNNFLDLTNIVQGGGLAGLTTRVNLSFKVDTIPEGKRKKEMQGSGKRVALVMSFPDLKDQPFAFERKYHLGPVDNFKIIDNGLTVRPIGNYKIQSNSNFARYFFTPTHAAFEGLEEDENVKAFITSMQCGSVKSIHDMTVILGEINQTDQSGNVLYRADEKNFDADGNPIMREKTIPFIQSILEIHVMSEDQTKDIIQEVLTANIGKPPIVIESLIQTKTQNTGLEVNNAFLEPYGFAFENDVLVSIKNPE